MTKIERVELVQKILRETKQKLSRINDKDFNTWSIDGFNEHIDECLSDLQEEKHSRDDNSEDE